MRQQSYKIILTVTIGFLLSFSAVNAKNFNIFNAASPSQSYFTVNGTSGNVGIGITNPTTLLQILNNGWISAQNAAGTGVVNMFKVNASNQIEVGAPLNIGSFEFSPDSGLVSFVDMPVTSGAASGTPEGYAFKVDGDNIMTAYSESNGTGGIQNKRLGIGLTNPTVALDVSGSLRNTLATTHSLLGGAGEVLVMADNSGNLYATSTTGFLGGGTNLWGGTTTGKIWNANYGYNIGMGTTNPFRKLDINQGVDGTQLQVRNNAADTLSQSAGIQFSLADSAVTTDEYAKGAIFLKGDGTDWGRGDFIFALDNAADAGNASTSDAKMVIRKDGNVGVGVTNPGAKLSVSGNSTIGANWGRSTLGLSVIASYNNSAQSSPGDADRTLHLENPDNTTGSFAGLTMRAGSDGNATWYHIMHKKTGASAGTALHFVQATQVMALTSGGNVGIGTTNPTAQLNIESTGTSTLTLGTSNASNVATSGILRFQRGTANYAWAGIVGISDFSDQNGLAFYTAPGGVVPAAETMRLSKTGNLGIGTTAPDTKLYVAGTSLNTLATTHSLLGGAGNVVVMADNTGALYATSTAGFSGGTSLWGGTLNGAIYNGDAGAGNVGIGITNPGTKLNIQDNITSPITGLDNSATIKLRNTNWAEGTTGTGFIEHANDSLLLGETRASSGHIGFYTNNGIGLGERVTIVASGNVGIGTTNPLSKLTVQSDAVAGRGGELSIVNYAAATIGNEAALNFGVSPTSYNGDAGDAQIKAINTTGATVATDIAFSTWNGSSFGERMRIQSSGNVGIGTTTPSTLLYIYKNANNLTPSLILENANPSGSLGDVSLKLKTRSSNFNLFADDDTNFFAITDESLSWPSNARLVINGNGNVGISNTAPGTKLDVSGSLRNTLATTHSLLGGAGNVVIMADNTGALYATSTASLLSGGTSLWGGTLNGTIYNGDAGAGNVGIGTTVPNGKLAVAQNMSDYGPAFNNPHIKLLANNTVDTTGFVGITYAASSAVNYGWSVGANRTAGGESNFIWKYHSNDATGTERMRINQSGNVGIGTTVPSALLSVGSGNLFTVSSGGTVTAGLTSFRTSDQTNIATSASVADQNTLAFSPFGSYLWHDRLRFSTESGTPTFETYSGSWSADTLDNNLFAGNGGYNGQPIDGVTKTAARWTWNNGSFSYGQTHWWVIGIPYTATASTKNFLIETSADGISWTTRHTSTGNTANSGQVILYMPQVTTNYVRLTITVTNSQPLRVSTIQALSNRPGDQFIGPETEYPYTWDGSRNVRFYGNVGVGVSPTTKLDISGTFRNTLATTHSLLGGAGNVVVMADNTGALYATSTASLLSGGTSLWGGTLNGTIYNGDAGAGNVGIGTTTPSTKLQIVTSGINGVVIGDSAYPSWMGAEGLYVDGSFRANSYLVNSANAINWGASTARIIGYSLSTSDPNSYLGFWTGESGNHYERMRIINNGNIGIGTTTPAVKLDVIGAFRNTLATTHSLLGGAGEVLVMADASGNLYATSTAGFIGGSGSYLPLTGGSLSGNLNMGGNNITNINKLTVNTIDPLYNIKGINYSTFASSIAGGVKEEYLGRVKINNLTADGEREYIIDFDNLATGSDLWVWRQTVDFSVDNVEVIATPYGNFAQVYYKIEGNKIIFRADRATTISYRLSGRRIDWRSWPTKALDQEEKAGFVIE